MENPNLNAIQTLTFPIPSRPKPLLIFNCVGVEELKETLYEINKCGFVFLTATQSGDVYTVFFWRHVR